MKMVETTNNHNKKDCYLSRAQKDKCQICFSAVDQNGSIYINYFNTLNKRVENQEKQPGKCEIQIPQERKFEMK